MSVTDPLIGKKLGDYTIETLLGTGGMARVYRGLDRNLERHAAIKVIEPQLIASDEEDEYRDRFLREARAIARLNHPNIVSIYQFNQFGNYYYIAMEYVAGQNLRTILKDYFGQQVLIPTSRLIKILNHIADALDYAHQQKIIHRDVKPSNIIVGEDDNAVLTDFGLALNAVEGTIGNTFGSVHYIAPEQAISSAQAVPQSDQYSLAIVAYEMLTGQVPFDDASAMSIALKHISDPPPPPTEINPNIPLDVEHVLMNALEKEPARRYGTVRQFITALRAALGDVEQGSITPPTQLSSSTVSISSVSKTPLPDNQWEDSIGKSNSRLRTNRLLNSKSKRDEQATAEAATSDSRGRLRLVFTSLVIGLLLIFGAIALVTGLMRVRNADPATPVVLNATDVEAENTSTVAPTNTLMPTPTSTPQNEPAALVIDAETATARPTDTDEPTHTPTSATNAETVTPPTSTRTPSATTATGLNDSTQTPELRLGEDEAVASVLLRYDGRMLLIGNRSRNQSFDVSGLVFVLFEPDDDDVPRQVRRYPLSRAAFAIETDNLTPGRCLNILDSRLFSSQPRNIALAQTLCTGTPFWATTINTFWISNVEGAYFEVRMGTQQAALMRCEAQVARSLQERRCVVNLEDAS